MLHHWTDHDPTRHDAKWSLLRKEGHSQVDQQARNLPHDPQASSTFWLGLESESSVQDFAVEGRAGCCKIWILVETSVDQGRAIITIAVILVSQDKDKKQDESHVHLQSVGA